MKLFKITKNKSLHFKMSDGRIGTVCKSGYVRVSVKGDNRFLYQINKKKLVSDHVDRVQLLYTYDLKNCQL